MFRRRQRLLASCGLFLVYVAVSQLAARYSAGPSSETHPGGRRLLQTVALSEPPPPAQLNCSRPAIERFPSSGLTQDQRRHGGVVLYIAAALYCFLGLAIVCDDYFVPALEVTANSLGLSEDVAGATLLAAGSSAPELATTTLGVFVTKDDIGISGVIGSAVFNAMLVISLVSLLVDDKIRIKCYPMLRDILCYLISIAALLAVIYDNFIAWYEALALVSMYVLYCLVMWKNRAIERWILSRYLSAPSAEKRSLMTRDHQPAAAGDSEEAQTEENEEDASEAIEQEMTANVHEVPYDDNDTFRWPDGTFSRVLHVISLPIVVGCYLTMPDVGKRRWRPWYPVTFVVATLWIALFSYLMVWMITVIGFTMNIPDTIMGLSFVAIGVSIPDVLASVAVARDGYGDMAVSNALGSNVFDILFCMGVPWLISTLLVYPGSYVKVDSGGMLYSTVFLFSTVIFLLVATYLSRWTLSKPYGISLLVWYALFLSVACLYEMNFFGQMTLPMCPSLA
ncbi:probable sodium/potassium/calcium exchanger CG1090 isoform X2 [Amphibalanus amphitrite]|nr:probable sodium/potassium/calcium exchanger CG1090 isoform X2 [Amphibalanus amphitrite]XP_043226734.1 probable sodium/potassium/calcium exchanger CG1090 isoform X2 [Amphibalanus amphitrite]